MYLHKAVYGPVYSRRLGVSLGVNLLPAYNKLCNFNCIYCECGWTDYTQKLKYPDKEIILSQLEQKLQNLKAENKPLDSITFAGNGEPTMHPYFPEIINATIIHRNTYFPETDISVLSNSSLIHKAKVFDALNKVDNNILKLDSGIESTLIKINLPNYRFNLNELIRNMIAFKGNLILQTIFLKGEVNGQFIDNTTQNELDAYLSLLKKVKPEKIMIYSLDRATPAQNLQKIPQDKMDEIGTLIQSEGFEVIVAE